MADTKCKYRSGDEAEALQARYRQLIETRDGGTPAEAVALATRDYGMSEADASVSWATAQRIEQALPAARCGRRSRDRDGRKRDRRAGSVRRPI